MLLSGAGVADEVRDAKPGLEAFDLNTLPPLTCADDKSDEIVVCGKRPKEMDITTLPPATFVEEPIRAEKDLGFGKVDMHLEQRTLPNGMSAPGLVVTLKIPF